MLKPISYVGCEKYALKVPNAEINTIFAREIAIYLERHQNRKRAQMNQVAGRFLPGNGKVRRVT